jgi:hypothetical protein
MNVIKLNPASITAITDVAKAGAAEERATLAGLPALRKQFAGCTREQIRDTVALNYGKVVGLKEEHMTKKTGAIVFPKGWETPKRACNRLIERILGESSDRAEREEIEVPEELLAAAAKLAKLAQQYEGARKLANKAVALAFAK